MTKVTISGNASGTGNVNFAAPNTNSAITVTLPTANVDMDNLGPSTDLNAVGTYALIRYNGGGANYDTNSLVAMNGSTSFDFWNLEGNRQYTYYPAGTWRTMGQLYANRTCICVRVS